MYHVLCFSKSFTFAPFLPLMPFGCSMFRPTFQNAWNKSDYFFFLCSEDFQYNVCRVSPKQKDYSLVQIYIRVKGIYRYKFCTMEVLSKFQLILRMSCQHIHMQQKKTNKFKPNLWSLCCIGLDLGPGPEVEETWVENLGGEKVDEDPHCCSHYGFAPFVAHLLWSNVTFVEAWLRPFVITNSSCSIVRLCTLLQCV